MIRAKQIIFVTSRQYIHCTHNCSCHGNLYIPVLRSSC